MLYRNTFLLLSLLCFTQCHEEPSNKAPELTPEIGEDLSSAEDSLIDSIGPDQVPEGMVFVPGGLLNMGGDNEQADQDEFPKHKVQIAPFFMDEHEVTNAQFAVFVEETGYVTIAEKDIDWEEMKKQLPPDVIKPPEEMLKAGSLVFQPTNQPVPLNNPGVWWKWTIGANWRQPKGPGSSIKGKEAHPVVHIAWEDAEAYAKWAGKRLPTEAEWEWAARGGEANLIYPWGNEDINENPKLANFWQGIFPYDNKELDGYYTTAPVKQFPANPYGLYDMAGNVWEWCSDWYRHDYYGAVAEADNIPDNLRGPKNSFDPFEPTIPKRVIRGGSFLCNDAYCSGYRVARRMKSSPDSGFNHTGFRCVKEVSGAKD